MELKLFDIPNLDIYLVSGILLFFALVEIIAGRLKSTRRTASDWIQEAGNMAILSGLTKPAIVFALFFLGKNLFPGFQGHFDHLPFWLGLIIFLPVDDLLQYWYHRKAHEMDWLWKLHRPHHQAEEMGFFVSYRNAALYYLIMPNIWWTGALAFLGLGEGVALGIVIKQVIIIGSHSTVKWDKPFYQSKFLLPFIKVLERIIITPAFHHAHHGRSQADKISDPNGNFGNMFSIWDQLFGSAVFTHKFPSEYGLQKQTQDPWSAAMFFPLLKSKDERSEISKGFRNQDTRRMEPSTVEVEKGKTYLWCRCGRSQNQPFCDGSHHGTKHKPLVFEAPKDGALKLCNCKLTRKGPFCDNSHLQ